MPNIAKSRENLLTAGQVSATVAVQATRREGKPGSVPGFSVPGFSDAAGTSGFHYDGRGRLDIYTPPLPSGYTVTYDYNNANEKTSESVKQGTSYTWTTSYEYYNNGSLRSVDAPDDIRVDYTYDAAGKPMEEGYGNGTYAAYSYNDALQLSGLDHYNSSDVRIVTSEYERDNVGNPTLWDSGSTSTTCSYDAINRLTGATYHPGSAVSFSYDWVGNRNNEDWQTNTVDELMMDGLGNHYLYDHVYGNLSTYNDYTSFEYDDYNLLKRIHFPNDYDPVEFVSDAAGNRVSMTTTEENNYKFIYDTTAGIPAVLAQVESGATRLFVRTPDGRLIAQAHIASGDAVLDHYYHFDGLGSTRALTNASGIVTDSYTYDVWGNPTHSGSGNTQQPYLFVGQLGYYTHYQEPMMDAFSSNPDKYVLLQLGVRYYAPEIGRFTQRDPAQDGWNYYRYADNTPLVGVDPDGLQVIPWLPPVITDPSRRSVGDVYWTCTHDMVNFANAEAADAIGAGRLGKLTPDERKWAQDALRHCTGSCKMQIHCGQLPGCVAGFGHELKQWPFENAASRMDLVNNKNGRACASAIQSGHYNGSCLDCCVKKYLDGRLRRTPTPWPKDVDPIDWRENP